MSCIAFLNNLSISSVGEQHVVPVFPIKSKRP